MPHEGNALIVFGPGKRVNAEFDICERRSSRFDPGVTLAWRFGLRRRYGFASSPVDHA